MNTKYYGLILGSLLVAHLAAGQALAPDSVQQSAPEAASLVATSPVLAADTTRYYPATEDKRVESQTDSTGICTELLRSGPHQGLLRTFHASGGLRTYEPYLDCDNGVRHGHVSSWYENGQLEALEPYVQGQRQGNMLLYYENGQLKRQSQYEAGRELPGLCYDPAGQPVAYFPYEQLPLYPGGAEQLTRELNRVLRRVASSNALARYLTSYVQISFLIAADGRVEQPRLEVSSMLSDHDQAVLAAIGRLSRAWVPGLRDGQPAIYRYRLRVPVGAAAVPTALWQR